MVETNSNRFFKIIQSNIGYVSSKTGYYKGIDENYVANKFGKMLFNLVQNDKYYNDYKDVSTIKILLRETTRGSKRQIFCFKIKKFKSKKSKDYIIKSSICNKNDAEILKMFNEIDNNTIIFKETVRL
tara:strand:+ start:518 stop:901 length:384 start_codon:yes stop_codon:yes gene_type:complete